jgi:hypothetical protein
LARNFSNATFRALAAASWRCMKSGCLGAFSIGALPPAIACSVGLVPANAYSCAPRRYDCVAHKRRSQLSLGSQGCDGWMGG